jgi:hypothetical protein
MHMDLYVPKMIQSVGWVDVESLCGDSKVLSISRMHLNGGDIYPEF